MKRDSLGRSGRLTLALQVRLDPRLPGWNVLDSESIWVSGSGAATQVAALLGEVSRSAGGRLSSCRRNRDFVVTPGEKGGPRLGSAEQRPAVSLGPAAPSMPLYLLSPDRAHRDQSQGKSSHIPSPSGGHRIVLAAIEEDGRRTAAAGSSCQHPARAG